jgi:hypothetical protein
MAAGKLHADDKPVPVLAPGLGKIKTGGCGLTCATNVPRVTAHPLRCGSRIQPDRKGEQRECRGNLQSAGHRQTERNRSRRLSTGGVVAYRGSSDQAHRGVATLERRRKSVTRNRRSGVNQDAATKVGVGSSSELPHIAELIIDGEITVGTLVPVGCVAIATDGHNTLAMLKRREGETLARLLTRLDLAIGKAFTENVFTDEINTPLENSHRR